MSLCYENELSVISMRQAASLPWVFLSILFSLAKATKQEGQETVC